MCCTRHVNAVGVVVGAMLDVVDFSPGGMGDSFPKILMIMKMIHLSR